MHVTLGVEIIVFFGTAVFLGCLWLALAAPGIREKKILQGRVQAISARTNPGAPAGALGAASGGIKKTLPGWFRGLENLAVKFLPRPEILRRRLAATGRPLSLGGYITLSAALFCAAAMGLWVSGVLAGPPSVAAGIVAGAGLPHLCVNLMTRRRVERFNHLFPDAIDLMVRGLRAGLPVSETISTVGRELADPVGGEFRTIAESVKLGRSLEDALWETAARLDTPEFKFFVISLSVQKETGGNLAETLSNLADILRSRRQMGLKVRAMSSEARASALILGSLPIVMFGLIYLLNPDYGSQLLTDPRGRSMLIGAGVVMVTGVAVMRKMVRFEI